MNAQLPLRALIANICIQNYIDNNDDEKIIYM